MPSPLTQLLIKRFIARADVKAQQVSADAYMPVRESKDGPFIPWTRDDVEAHLAKTKTFGHYLLGTDNTCKLFAFDIDLTEAGFLAPSTKPLTTDKDIEAWERSFEFGNPREAWLNRKHPGREQLKLELKLLAHKLAQFTYGEMDIPTAVAYSGSKGLHVYAFTGRMPAEDARAGAQIVLDALGFTAGKGNYQHPDFKNMTVEVYPKQSSINGEGLGNLMRLPLGRNLKAPKEPAFFVDMTSPLNMLLPVDAEFALQGNPWKREGE